MLDKGSHKLIVEAKGTPAYLVYPVVTVMINDNTLKEIHLDGNYTVYEMPFDLKEKSSVTVQLKFDQDGLDDKGNDRDIFIRDIDIDPS
jgi:hypothetical protein